MVSVGWSKDDHTAAPLEFLSTKLPESSSAAAVTPRLAVPEDQRGVVEESEGRSWRSPEERRRRTAEELTEAPACHMGMFLLYVMAAMRVPAEVEGSAMKERAKVLFVDSHVELESEA